MTIPERPLIKRHLFSVTIEHDDVFVLSEDRIWLWKSHKLGFLLAHLDGSRTLSDLLELGGSEVSPPEMIYLLKQLRDEGLLAEGSDSTSTYSDAEVGFWHAAGVDECAEVERLRGSPIAVTNAASGSGGRLLADALQAAGLCVAEGAEAALQVVVVDHYFQPELAECNLEALRSGTPWMPMKLVGQTHWIGPIFRPGETGCMTCLQDRLRLNRQVEDFVVRKTGDPRHYATSSVTSPAAVRLSSTWASHEILMWLAGPKDRLEGKLLSVSFNGKGTDVRQHDLVRQPQCPCCGDPETGRRKFPIALHRAVTQVSTAQRMETPQATFDRLQRHISPITGVVTWLSNLDQDTEGLVHCYSAGHSFSLGPDTTHWLRQSLRSRTGGKGSTEIQAKVSAVCEAIERYCGVFRDDVPRISATWQELGDRAVHPYQCLNFSDRQYALRDELNADEREGFFHLIPRRFQEDVEIEWLPAWSLIHENIRYLPAAFCYYAHPDVERHFFCTGDANGCAAGNSIEEATLHAFLELVERDGAAIWWYNQLARPEIDLESATDPYLRRVRRYYEEHGRQLWAIDLTSDLGIPVIAAVSQRTDAPVPDLLFGLGAALDPSTALLKAVTEVNQFLRAVARRDANNQTLYSWPDNVAVRFWKNETLASQPQLLPNATMPRRALNQLPNLAGDDAYDGVQACLNVARRAGLDVLLLDQSRPDIGLPVVRVVAPGLRHFWRRLGPGRLYDVPVKLGWKEGPTPEEKLNPVSIFF